MSIKLRFSVTCILYRRKLPDITPVLNVYVIHIKFLQSASFLLLKVSFSRPFQLMKINSTEWYVFFLARIYRARIHLSFTNMRGIQYSPYINLCVSRYRVLGQNTSILMNIKIGIDDNSF